MPTRSTHHGTGSAWAFFTSKTSAGVCSPPQALKKTFSRRCRHPGTLFVPPSTSFLVFVLPPPILATVFGVPLPTPTHPEHTAHTHTQKKFPLAATVKGKGRWGRASIHYNYMWINVDKN